MSSYLYFQKLFTSHFGSNSPVVARGPCDITVGNKTAKTARTIIPVVPIAFNLLKPYCIE